MNVRNSIAISNFVSGQFDSNGVSEGEVPSAVGVVEEMRIVVHSESDKWAILSEVNYI